MLSLQGANVTTIIISLIAISAIYLIGSFIGKILNAMKKRRMLSGIPGNPHPLYGSMDEFPGPGPEVFNYFMKKTRLYKTFYQFWYGPMHPAIQLVHPDTAKIMFKSSEPKYTKEGGGGYSFLVDWLGDGLLLQSGAKWFRNRKLLTPAFHFDILKTYINIYQNATNKYCDKMVDIGNSGKQSVAIYSHVNLLTLDIILKCAFSYEADIQKQGSSDPYVASVLQLTELILRRLYTPRLHNPILFYLSPTGRQSRKACSVVHKFVTSDVINKRKISLAENPDAVKKRYLDFLDILLAARDEDGRGLSDIEIRDEVVTFLFGGHDTIASGISWTIYELAKNPEIQEQARQEVIDVLEGRDHRVIEWEDLSCLPYMTQCIKESMRMHPPVPFINRQLTKDVVIEGHTIPKNTQMDIVIYAIHHNPLVWGEDHLEYKPERFHPDNIRNRDAYAFVPFSAGSRNCIGQNFAMNEQKVIIATLLYRFEMLVDPNHKVQQQPEATTRPTNDIKIFFKPRPAN